MKRIVSERSLLGADTAGRAAAALAVRTPGGWGRCLLRLLQLLLLPLRPS